MRHTNGVVALIFLLLIAGYTATAAEPADAPTQLVIQPGQRADGRPTEEWLEAIRAFHDDEALARIANSPRHLDAEEKAWADLIRQRAQHWTGQIDYLLEPFGEISPPQQVTIFLGNQGGNDAFIAEQKNIAFDLARLGKLYGSGTTESNEDRIDRFFDHEFTHLLHKEWRRVHQPRIETPLERALYVCLTEGLGNYRSLSARWTDADGSLSAHARQALQHLQPILVDRLSKLSKANDEEAPELLKGLSMGPFEDKWGALPVALWLTQETREDEAPLQHWVAAGPPGILELAAKYLPPDLAARLPAAP